MKASSAIGGDSGMEIVHSPLQKGQADEDMRSDVIVAQRFITAFTSER